MTSEHAHARRVPLSSIWRGTYALVGLGLVILIATRFLADTESGDRMLITASTPADDIAGLLARDEAAGLVYTDATAPTFGVATLMAGAAEYGTDVALVVPDTPARLRVTAPVAPVARRRGALDVSLRGEPGEEVTVTIDALSGASDTIVVQIGSSGTAKAAVAVEPARAGAATWRVRAADETATVHAWVRPEAPARVLVLTGAPGWESRYLVRALEAAGAVVGVRQDLGRDQAVASAGGLSPRTLRDLEQWDVVALVGPVASVSGDLLIRWAAERGGGILMAGGVAAESGLSSWSPTGIARPRPASGLEWAGPVEIVPLPPSDITPLMAPIRGEGVRVAWSDAPPAVADMSGTAGPTWMAADWIGRGRIFVSGVETWPWAMEAGLGSSHRDFWESVVEWLASGLTADVAITASAGRAGIAWQGRLEGDAPASFEVIDPTSASVDRLTTLDARRRSARVRFVPSLAGAYSFGTGPGALLGMATASTEEPTTWTEAALEIGGSGGSIRSSSERADMTRARRFGGRTRSLWLVFLVLALSAGTGWTTRRVSGLS